MSDITALHQAIQLNTSLITFLSPVLNYFSEDGDGFDDCFAFDHLQQLILEKKSGQIPTIPGSQGFEIIRAGRACGPIVGGNLSLIAALCGTRWQLNTKQKILLLEDVGEEIYRLDRLLWQLKESGLLDDPAAVILSSWKDCVATLEISLTLDQVFDHCFGEASYPVIKNFTSGNDRYQATIPLNALFEIDTNERRVELLAPSVQ